MYQTSFSVYLGHEDEKSFIGFSAEGGFFIILKVDEGLEKEKGRELIKRMGAEIEQTAIKNLSDFETFLADHFKQADIPSGFSCAAGLVSGNILLLKTVGTGQIYLKRGKDFAKLIDGDKSASGYISSDDFLAFTTHEFVQVLGDESQLKEIFAYKKPHDLVEAITPQLKTRNDTGIIALFVNFEAEKVADVELVEEVATAKVGIKDQLSSIWTNLTGQLKTQDRKKKWTFVAVAVISVVFIWSVFLGYQRRTGTLSQNQIAQTRELIVEKLIAAEEVAFLNLPRATALISEAKTSLADLKKVAPDPDSRQIQELEKLITDKEAQILKKEERTANEFFDLSVENRDVSAITMYLDGDNLAVLDPKGAIYVLSLSKKSLERRSSDAAKGTSIVTMAQDRTYVFRKGSGIVEITADGKATKVINNDPDWRDVADLATYNNNLYLLDSGGDEVYKYLVAEAGFSQKSSYFESGQNAELQNANSLAIDSSVYIGLPNRVLKYVTGVQDTFNASFPEDDSQLTKIFTSKDIEKVYGWDKNKGAIYVIDKSGSYDRQINSPILKTGTDFVVFGGNAYVISGSKIFSVSME